MRTDRDLENDQAIGGMRNPKTSLKRLPKSAEIGKAISIFLRDAAMHPSVQGTVDDLMDARPSEGIAKHLVEECRKLVLHILDFKPGTLPTRSAKASSPINPEVLWAWGQVTDDPDSQTLARWVLEGAPLGFSESIPLNGIFPPVQGQWREESAKALIRDIQGWSNYQSAEEEQEALQGLIQEAVDAGFCTIYNSVKQAEVELGRTPLLNIAWGHRQGERVRKKV